MATSEEKEDNKESTSSKKSKDSKAKPCVIIFFKIKEGDAWSLYPRVFNNEETAISKLEQSYRYEEHHVETINLP